MGLSVAAAAAAPWGEWRGDFGQEGELVRVRVVAVLGRGEHGCSALFFFWRAREWMVR